MSAHHGALTAGAGGFFRAGRHRLGTELAEAVSPIECHSVPGWKRAPGDRKIYPSRLFQQFHFFSLLFLVAALRYKFISWRSINGDVWNAATPKPAIWLWYKQTNKHASLWRKRMHRVYSNLTEWFSPLASEGKSQQATNQGMQNSKFPNGKSS